MDSSVLTIVEGPPLDHAVPEATVPEFVRKRLRERGHIIALIDAESGRSVDCLELDRLIGRFAAGLAACGFQPGETMLMFAPNSIEWPIVALGTLVNGGIVSGANPAYRAEDLALQMRDARAKFAFTTPELLPTVREAAALAGCETIIVLGDAADVLSYATLVESEEPEPDVAIALDSLAALPFSSGTTGTAKGVRLTHRIVVSNLVQCTQVRPMDEREVTLVFLPMFHIYGFTVITLMRLAGAGTVVTMPRFEAEPFLKAIERYRVTHLPLVPPLVQFLAAHPLVNSYDLSSLQQVGCGAAPLGLGLQQKLADQLKCVVAQGYGMTESSGVIAASAAENTRLGSCGQLLPATQARIVDPVTGADLPRGVAGEIWFRGPQAFGGYLNRPDETASTLDAEGWVHTGDIGYFDDDGFLFLTDRLKELIKVKGFQVAPAELEALLVTHPNVGDVAVIGRPDERAGETPVAYVVARGEFDAGEVKAWLAERVVEYKQLGAVVTIDAIPKSPSGKILRRILRETDAAAAR